MEENAVKIYLEEEQGVDKLRLVVDVVDRETAASMCMEAYKVIAEEIIKTHNCGNPDCDLVDVNYRIMSAIREIAENYQKHNKEHRKK